MKGSSMNRRNVHFGGVACLVLVCGLLALAGWEHHRRAPTTLNQGRQLPTITIASNGKMYVAGKQVTISQLEVILRQSR